MFPILPVAAFLLEMYPWLETVHEGLAWAGLAGLTVYGLGALAHWVPKYNEEYNKYDRAKAREKIQGALGLLTLGVVSLITGIYIWILVCVGIAGYLLWVLVKGIIIAFTSKDNG